ncbi:MAG: hypothetical protein QM676_02380 [Novosphingobium sp.]
MGGYLNYAMSPEFHTWPELLDCLRTSPDLSQDEKEWILGRTARKVLKWPAPASPPAFAPALPTAR